jgi:FkbM family methyltransferase
MISFKQFIYNITPEIIKKFYFYNYSDKSLDLDYFGHRVDLEINKINFSLFLKDRSSFNTYSKSFDNEIIYEETLLFALTKILKKFKNPSFFDIGSYLGYYSIYLSKLLGPNSNIYAFESNSEISSLISKSIEYNKVKNITLFNNVLSDKSEEVIVYDTLCMTRDKIESILENTLDKHEETILKRMLNVGYKTQSLTLDEICKKNQITPDIIKIDVHGSEGQVLLGAKNFILKKTKFIFLELHPVDLIKKNSNDMVSSDIFNLFYELDFKTYMISPFRYTARDNDFIKFKKIQKLQYLEITSKNISHFLFDRKTDSLILAINKNLSIEDLVFLSESN